MKPRKYFEVNMKNEDRCMEDWHARKARGDICDKLFPTRYAQKKLRRWDICLIESD